MVLDMSVRRLVKSLAMLPLGSDKKEWLASIADDDPFAGITGFNQPSPAIFWNCSANLRG